MIINKLLQTVLGIKITGMRDTYVTLTQYTYSNLSISI